ncbi:MAG: hypothetical protein GQF41_3751 [Candidatus Rifleibacterium amylolyticum]|nr:MAG: hypothetical protein GQF41_3751 [Candidatus Rifleibacterium amylolyticum]
MRKVIMSSVLALVLCAAPSFAGNPGQSGNAGQAGQSQQSGQATQVGQSGHANQSGCHKPGFFKNVKKAFKKGFKAGKKVGTKAFDAVQNKVMDSGVAVKKAVTGKKCKTFVKGHYDKNGNHTKGHFRKVKCNKPCKK